MYHTLKTLIIHFFLYLCLLREGETVSKACRREKWNVNHSALSTLCYVRQEILAYLKISCVHGEFHRLGRKILCDLYFSEFLLHRILKIVRRTLADSWYKT